MLYLGRASLYPRLMATAYVELPEQSWGPMRLLTVRLERPGCTVDQVAWADGTSSLRIG
jgi:hypothetical protein